ncbi:ATO2 Ammonia transport outward protein 2 [Candida maltosa Xu316]
MQAFLGTLNPGYTTYTKNPFGNASALGLACFASTTFVLGLFYAHAKGIKQPNVMVGIAVFYGGLVEFLAGCYEFMNGNTFAYTVFCSYGSFWITLGCINVPSFGIISAYEDPVMLGNALGFFLLGWGLFTFMMLTLTVKATLPFMLLFVTLDTGFFVLAGAYMTGSVGAMKSGGIVLVISACCGFYGMIAGIPKYSNQSKSGIILFPIESFIVQQPGSESHQVKH